MRSKRSFILAALIVVLIASSFGMASAQGDLGSEDNPIQVFFVPSVEASVITTGGEVMAQALQEATGLHFQVFVPTSYAATIEAMCAAPDSSIGFIPAAGYVIANERCGVQVAAAAVRNGWNVYWAEYIVRRDAPIYTFGDLDGKTWAVPDSGSTSGYIVPAVELEAAGITPGEIVEAGGHNQVIQAVYSGEVDFGTTFFSPALVPGAPWSIGDLSEPYDLTVDESRIGENGGLFVGDVQVMDARANIRETAPDVVDQVRILRLSAPIPNDTMSFGPDFPAELQAQIMDAVFAFAETEAWGESIGNSDFYSWSGIAPIDDATYDSVRLRLEILGLTETDIFGG
ncbi:MAG: phosphate/phosphite/phosphonate ABC transporter substrate-binding protein [Anaerolineae bacterium]|nr:phosphate/phosphite/phosphonate ABC transporter substrate-binding protein [Anaerolineae bacterium]